MCILLDLCELRNHLELCFLAQESKSNMNGCETPIQSPTQGPLDNKDILRKAAVLSQVHRESSVFKSVNATEPLGTHIELGAGLGLLYSLPIQGSLRSRPGSDPKFNDRWTVSSGRGLHVSHIFSHSSPSA